MSSDDMALIRELTARQTPEARAALLSELDVPTLERLDDHFMHYDWGLFPDGAINCGLISARLRDLYHRQQSLAVAGGAL